MVEVKKCFKGLKGARSDHWALDNSVKVKMQYNATLLD